MSILGLAVYGSRARGDYTNNSDTDLFAITDDAKYQMIENGKTNMACYPYELAMSRSSGGDLFFMHIVKEAAMIYDSGSYFECVRGNFRYKETYTEELQMASEVGYGLLLNRDAISDFSAYNRRLIWCVRTVLIAKSAEMRNPKFSAKDLAELFRNPKIESVVEIKDSDCYEKGSYLIAGEILDTLGCKMPIDMPRNYSDLVGYFERKNNKMGVRTAQLLSHDIESDEYGWM